VGTSEKEPAVQLLLIEYLKLAASDHIELKIDVPQSSFSHSWSDNRAQK
jgi:hypothetical protein